MFGGQNMQSMMKQVKKMQEQMQNEQEAIAATDYTGHAPSDVVLATFNGNRELKDLQIISAIPLTLMTSTVWQI